MTPKRKQKRSGTQQPITELALPLLKKLLEQIGKQIDVPGSYWLLGRSADDRQARTTKYKCTVREFTPHPKQVPKQARAGGHVSAAGDGCHGQHGDGHGQHRAGRRVRKINRKDSSLRSHAHKGALLTEASWPGREREKRALNNYSTSAMNNYSTTHYAPLLP